MRKLGILLWLLLVFSDLYAVPMSPELREKLNAEGNYETVVDIIRAAKLKGVDLPTAMPFKHDPNRTDTLKAIVILIDFSDNIGSTPIAHYDSLLSSCGCYPTGSMRDYYLEVSYDGVEFITTVVGWFRMPQLYTYYTNGNYGFGTYPMNAQRMAEDAVWAADSAVDFSEFDNDNDGIIDALFVVHAGPGAESTGDPDDIWSHAWCTVNVPYVDSVYAMNYSTEPENGKIGVFCHEAGHSIFGLPDLYDYDYDSYGLGNWSLMAYGSWNYSGLSPGHVDAYCRILAGFASPQVVTSNQDSVMILNVNENPVIFKLWRDGIPASEYFLVENRVQTGFDTYLPWRGLMIYHVDEAVSHNNNQWYPGYTSYGHYKVALEQSDSLWQLEHYTNAGNAGDPYPGYLVLRMFNDTSVPDSKDYNFISTHVGVENVSDPGDTMTADFIVYPTAVEEITRFEINGLDLTVSPAIGHGQFKIAFDVNIDFHDARVEIYDAAGRLVKSFGPVYEKQIIWCGDDDSGRQLAPGAYFVRLSVEGTASTISLIEKIVFVE